MTMATDAEKHRIHSQTLQPHEQRVVQEQIDLDEKVAKLTAFYKSDTFHEMHLVDQALLIAQAMHMRAYSTVLGMRIARFMPSFTETETPT